MSHGILTVGGVISLIMGQFRYYSIQRSPALRIFFAGFDPGHAGGFWFFYWSLIRVGDYSRQMRKHFPPGWKDWPGR